MSEGRGGGRGLSGLLHLLVTQPFCGPQLFSGAPPLLSPHGAPSAAAAAEVPATTALRSARPQPSELRVIDARLSMHTQSWIEPTLTRSTGSEDARRERERDQTNFRESKRCSTSSCVVFFPSEVNDWWWWWW